jgi:hypothetical protein
VLRLIAVQSVEALDLAPFVADHRNVLLMSEGGGIFFAADATVVDPWPGRYEVHTNFLKAYRGRNVIRASLNAYRWMFTRTDCMTLLTKVPSFNKAAEWFCKHVGATKEFTRANAWPDPANPCDVSYWSMSYDSWVRNNTDVLETGRKFHARLDEEFARHGKTDNHPEDEAHDRYVGACVEMIYGGQPEKGIILYNRWARFTNYSQIDLLTRDPLVIDIGTALLEVDAANATFKAIVVR